MTQSYTFDLCNFGYPIGTTKVNNKAANAKNANNVEVGKKMYFCSYPSGAELLMAFFSSVWLGVIRCLGQKKKHCVGVTPDPQKIYCIPNTDHELHCS